MNADRVKSLLMEVVERPEGERDAYIDAACADDPSLGARVRALVEAYEAATRDLREPTAAAAQALDALVFEKPGDRIGPYTLVESLGEGGFGMVFRARQDEPVRREIALKVLKPGMDSRAILARFDAERQALARLTHPGIARIHDAGATPAGRPFFAMELVEGAPITRYCDAQHLTLRERLLLVRDVCLAVQHAHGKGIIHRDLKPSNILITEIDGRPQPKVIDFGISKAIDEPLSGVENLTLAHQVVGTPRYMAPEQATLGASSVDTRSDVYSLGVVLYELLCGTTPMSEDELAGARVAELSRVIGQARVPTPSTRLLQRGGAGEVAARRGMSADRLARLLAGDLDWIAMRAIDPDPARRYPTAFALGRDLERYLAGEPVEARPPSTLYRAHKFVGRHRVLVGAGAAVVLSLVGGLVVAVAAQRRAAHDRDAARVALAEAQAVTDFLSRTISSVEPDQRGREVRVAELLDAASAELAAGTIAPDSSARSRMHHVLGTSYWALGDWSSAERELRAALEVREQLAGPDDPVRLRLMGNLASVLYESGDLESALAISTEAVERTRATLGDEHEQTLGVLGNHALMLSAAGRHEDAIEIERTLVTLNERLLGPASGRTVGSMQNYANSLADFGRYEEAEAVYKDALARAEEHLGPEAPETVLLRVGLSGLYHALGRHEEALPYMQSVVVDRERIYGPTHPQTLIGVYNLGANTLSRGFPAEAVPHFARILDASPSVLPATHPVVVATLTNLITIYSRIGWADAPEGLSERVAELVSIALEGPALPVATRNDLAATLLEVEPETLRRPAEALEIMRTVCAEAEAQGDPFLYGYLDTLALALAANGLLAEAVQVQQRALDLCPEDQPAHRASLEANLAEKQALLAAAGGAGATAD